MNLDSVVDQRIQLFIFDQGVNRGPSAAVKQVQTVLNVNGFSLAIDGDMGPKTIAAVNKVDPLIFLREYRQYCALSYADICVRNNSQIVFLKGWLNRIHHAEDTTAMMKAVAPAEDVTEVKPTPVVDPVVPTPPKPQGTTTFLRTNLADIAETEGKKKLTWAPGLEATKYTRDFEPVFGKARYSWCASFVRWCTVLAGLNTPIKAPSKFGYTFALVEAWQQWAIQAGFYLDNDGAYVPERGDIVIYDWEQTNINQPDTNWDSHIGVFLKMEGSTFICAEGNTGNMTNIKKRTSVNIQGFIKIPDGYKFAV